MVLIGLWNWFCSNVMKWKMKNVIKILENGEKWKFGRTTEVARWQR